MGDDSTLDGQQVVVVGGGSGIGLATARQARAAGAEVAVFDIDQDGLDRADAAVPDCRLRRLEAAEQLARAMALELAPIRVNAVAPGFTDTPGWDAVLGEGKAAVFQDAIAGQLTGRLGRPEEVAAAVLFLMHNRSVTGEVVHVDGGARLT